MLAYAWPIALIVFSNTLYQISAKSMPGEIHPMASLAMTYVVGAIVSLILYFAMNRGGNLLHELKGLNWAPYVLGIVIVGLEVGSIYAYRAGWPVSIEVLVQSSILAVVLIFVGKFLYGEPITWQKIVGLVLCLTGIVFINK